MHSQETIFYQSESGDEWHITTTDQSDPIVRHIANQASGGRVSTYELGAFLCFQRHSPENRALHQLIGALLSANPLQEASLKGEAQGEADLLDSLRAK